MPYENYADKNMCRCWPSGFEHVDLEVHTLASTTDGSIFRGILVMEQARMPFWKLIIRMMQAITAFCNYFFLPCVL